MRHLLVAFDGSWAEDTYGPSTDDTNVGLAARQWQGTVWYQEGVGSRHGWLGRWLGGVFGMGTFPRVRELENNIMLWRGRNPDAKLHGIGWSRGAVGLVTLANRLCGRGIYFDSLRLLDPVPGPFRSRNWQLQNPGVPISVVYSKKPKLGYRPLRLEGSNVSALEANASHSEIGRDPKWLGVVSLL